jgi:trimethylamine corrinoid protein
MPQPSHEVIKQAIVDGDADAARSLAQRLVDGGADLLEAIEEGFGRGIREVGDLWEAGEYFLPELVQGAEAMQAAMEILQPALRATRGGGEPRGRVVIGTVEGDLHDIGKSLVATLLAANGYEIHDLGSNVSVAAYLEKAREVGAHIVAASALLTTTMTVQKELVDAIEAADLPLRPRVLVGGAPTSPAWAREIGAAHAENAMRAVAAAGQLLDG